MFFYSILIKMSLFRTLQSYGGIYPTGEMDADTIQVILNEYFIILFSSKP